MRQLKKVINCYDLTAEEYAKTFYNELAHKPFDRLILERFAAENKTRGTIADLGCGCGHMTKFLSGLGAKDLIGIDLSPEMVKVASRLNQNIAFEVGNMLNLNKGDEEFGAVLAFYSIVHFDYVEVQKAFTEIYRILKPAGQFLFSFHVGDEKNELDDFLNHKIDITFYFFDVDKILELTQKAGFKTIDAIVRYPYKDKEYPSKRAYILVEK